MTTQTPGALTRRQFTALGGAAPERT